VGWIDNEQYIVIIVEEFAKLSKQEPRTAVDLAEFILKNNDILFPISIGSTVKNFIFYDIVLKDRLQVPWFKKVSFPKQPLHF
jgi:hypothetical protein